MSDPRALPRQRVSLHVPAGKHERFAPSAAESMIGQEFDLDEQIAGISALITYSLSADHRRLWTRARIVKADVVCDGMAIRVVVEGIR